VLHLHWLSWQCRLNAGHSGEWMYLQGCASIHRSRGVHPGLGPHSQGTTPTLPVASGQIGRVEE
jgi:hypothetical protein